MIRRLFHAPRVIVLVATIGVAELAQAVSRGPAQLPDRDSRRPRFPSPINGQWNIGAGITMSGAQLLAIIAVPAHHPRTVVALNHTKFGESVRASVSNPDLARLTGINPKMVSTAVWTIAGFLRPWP